MAWHWKEFAAFRVWDNGPELTQRCAQIWRTYVEDQETASPYLSHTNSLFVIQPWPSPWPCLTRRLFNFSPCWSDYSNGRPWDGVIRPLLVNGLQASLKHRFPLLTSHPSGSPTDIPFLFFRADSVIKLYYIREIDNDIWKNVGHYTSCKMEQEEKDNGLMGWHDTQSCNLCSYHNTGCCCFWLQAISISWCLHFVYCFRSTDATHDILKMFTIEYWIIVKITWWCKFWKKFFLIWYLK